MKKLLSFMLVISCLVFTQGIEISAGTLENLEKTTVEDRSHNGLTYSEFTFTIDGYNQKGYNVELIKGSNLRVVTHDLLYGSNAQGLSTVLEIAKDYEKQTGLVVYAATNGDYFSGGVPVDFYAKENDILRVGPYSESLGKNSFGFTDSHNSVIGKVEYGYKIKIFSSTGRLNSEIHVDKLNGTLEDGEIGIFTYNKKSTITGDNIAKLDVTFNTISGNYSMPFVGKAKDVSSFTFSDDNYSYSYKDFVIAAKGESKAYNDIKSTVCNDCRIEVYPYPVGDWQGMDFIVGGWQVLLNNGNILPDPLHDGWNTYAPRTTIGIKTDGTIGLTVTEGRMNEYSGITIEEQAYLQQQLGYETALEMDGGGSSTLLLRNLETDELEIMNTPSDGHLRSVANAVLIVGEKIEEEPEEPVVVTPTDPTVDDTTPDPEPTDNTGCFGSINNNIGVISLSIIAAVAGVIVYTKRK